MVTGGSFGAWSETIAAFESDALRSALKDEGGKALSRIGLRASGMAKRLISAKKYAPNSDVTIALKGTSTPLVGGGRGSDLIAAITSQVTDGGLTLWFGVRRTARGADGKPLVNIAAALHEGAVIDLRKHPGVRRAVMARLQRVAKGKEPGDSAKAQAILDKLQAPFKKGGKDAAMEQGGWATKFLWIIPPRPFLRQVLESPEFRDFTKAELTDAVSRSLNRQAKSALRYEGLVQRRFGGGAS